QVTAIVVEPNIHRQGFDEIFLVPFIVQRTRSEEQIDRCVDRGMLAIVPGDAKPGMAELRGLAARDAELERRQDSRAFQRSQFERLARSQGKIARASVEAKRVRFTEANVLRIFIRDVGSRAL